MGTAIREFKVIRPARLSQHHPVKAVVIVEVVETREPQILAVQQLRAA